MWQWLVNNDPRDRVLYLPLRISQVYVIKQQKLQPDTKDGVHGMDPILVSGALAIFVSGALAFPMVKRFTIDQQG